MLANQADAVIDSKLAAWPRPLNAWWAVAVFSLAAILSYTDRQILNLLIDPMRGELAISDTQVSLLQGIAFALIYSIAGLPLGRAADVFPRRIVIIVGIVLWTVATVACGYATSFEQLFAARMLVGVGEACLAPAAMSMIADYFPEQRRGTAISVFLLGMVVGGGAAIMIGGTVLQAVTQGLVAGLPVVGQLPAWRAVLVLMALPGAVLAILLLTVNEPMRRSQAGSKTAPAASLRTALLEFKRLRAILLPLYLAISAVGVADAAMGSWIAALLSRRFAMSVGDIGIWLGTAAMAGSAIGVFAGGLLADRMVARRGLSGRFLCAFAATALALPAALSGMLDSASAVIASFWWWGMMSNAATAIAITALQDTVPNHTRGMATSFASCGTILCGLAGGTSLTAWITDSVLRDPGAVGISMTMVALPASVLATAMFWYGLHVAKSRKWNS